MNWKRSSYSNGSGGNNCVEVARIDDWVVLRHSRHPDGIHLVFTPAEWHAFRLGMADGEFDDL